MQAHTVVSGGRRRQLRFDIQQEALGASPASATAAKTHESVDPLMLSSLAQPSAYPKDANAEAGVKHIETEIAHLFLTCDRVYKLRKAVKLGSIDLTTRSRRNAECVREIRLNGRLAPDAYLGVAPLVRGPRSFVLGALVDAVPFALPDTAEYCVVKRRLPAGREALAGEVGRRSK
jgi:hypothetical protein